MKRIWFRLNVIIGFPIVLFLDFMIWLTTDESFIKLRLFSLKRLKTIWYKY